MNTKGHLLASTLVVSPLSSFLMVAALGVGGVIFAIAFAREFGVPGTDDEPSRCPACGHDELMLIQASIHPSPIPLLHCRGCSEAYYRHGKTLIRDTCRPLF